MDTARQFYQPPHTQVSVFHFYSKGIVAQNKALKGTDGQQFNDVIYVTPIEEFTMLDGQLTPDTTQVTTQGADAAGKTYTTSVNMSNAIQAKWLKLGVGNRITAPDVRTGAEVMIYQFGDSDKFYWTTLQDDTRLRKLETVIWGFSGTKDENVENSADNMWYFEISTHSGMATFHTAQANGEFCTYDVQINGKDGKLIITDNVGQYIKIDSQAQQIHLENAAGSIFDITKEIGTFITKDQINMQTKTWTVTADTANLNCTTRTDKGDTLTINYGSQTITGDTRNDNVSSITYGGQTYEWNGATYTFNGVLFDVETASISLN